MQIHTLTKKSFATEVARYGFFAEQFPPCFNSEKMSQHVVKMLTAVDIKQVKASKKITSPTTLSTYKTEISRRILSVPNPEAFLMAVKLMSENWELVRNFAESENSLSPITYIHFYTSANAEKINCENSRESYRSKSDFLSGVHQRIRVSLGYSYQLRCDISNCYNSIYTHSITWAMCGKNQAKQYFRLKTPISIKETYEFADNLDLFTRLQKNNETNGIVVGPFTSRIVSEIVLSGVDKCLRKENLVFKRYVDDYRFFFRTEAEAQTSIPIIERILNEFNLNLNSSKTQICKYPYEIISPIKTAFDSVMKDEGILGVINTANTLYSRGEKGAYKYALKYIKDSPIPNTNVDVLLPLLINTMLVDPKYGKYVVDFLKENKNSLDICKLSNVINGEIFRAIRNELEQEVLLFMYMIKELELEIESSNMVEVLKSGGDMSIIIALDIWKNRKSSVRRTRHSTGLINNAIKQLLQTLNSEEYSGSRWLLLHEVELHNFTFGYSYLPPARNSFFSKLKQLEISFYTGM